MKSNFIKYIMVAASILMLTGLTVPSPSFAQTKEKRLVAPVWKGEVSQWEGFDKIDFKFDNRDAYVVAPKTPAPGNPWVWRARFPGFHAESDLILLARGFHIAHLNTNGLLGSPQAMESWDKFYQYLTNHGLAKKCVLEGVSRGGLFVYQFASRWPARVACIYCDTPVGDISSWPGGKGKGRGHVPTWQTCLTEYGLTEETAKNFKRNPIDILAPIAKNQIPILHIVSMNDVIVPPSENTFVLAERYRKLGGNIDIIKVEKGTENSGGHHFNHPEPVRAADFMERFGTTSPKSKDYFEIRGSLNNCRDKFENQKTGRVVFLGGSITTMKGWRELVCDYLQQKFPDTKFDFIDAGISSTGSVPGSFRLLRDVLAKGNVDLLFEEAAVNDLHNSRKPIEMIRGMEGIVRQARIQNPNIDIVMMHFVDPKHVADYRRGSTPQVIQQHEQVAAHYAIPSLNLAREITERMDSGQFDWKNDFRNCHPSPFGHTVYASSIRRLLNEAWDVPRTSKNQPVPHSLPEPINRYSYDQGKMVSLNNAKDLSGFKIDDSCDPRANNLGGGVRTGFHNVPMLVGTNPGDQFSLDFKGRAVGLFLAAGPDAGSIEYSIDKSEFKPLNLFTRWSGGLHIPWVYVLDSQLPTGPHQLVIRIAPTKDPRSKGHACRIVNLLVNE
ncbi:GDSL-type esterase/lipase family protein [bacterium]|nr:GDSL-type esterase/lipase family protein [bacterium]